MRTRLQDLSVELVSLVDRAATRDPINQNEPRRFLIYKREGDRPEGAGSMPLTLTDEMKDQIAKAAEEGDALAIARVLAKAGEDDAESSPYGKKKGGSNSDTEDDGAEARKAEKKAAKKAERKAAKKSAEDAAAAAEAISKGDPDVAKMVATAIEKAEKDANERVAKAEKSAEEASEIAKAERDRRISAEFIEKAEEFQALPVESAKFGPVLKEAAEKLTPEAYEALTNVLKSADETVSQGDFFREIGSSLAKGAASSAGGELAQRAEDLAKKENLRKDEAEARVMQSDPDLQKRYLAETRGL